MYWKIIEFVIPEDSGIGGKPPSYGWRDSNFHFKWEIGKPPAKLGVYCDENWKPLKEDDHLNIKFQGLSIHPTRIKYSLQNSKSYWKKFG